MKLSVSGKQRLWILLGIVAIIGVLIIWSKLSSPQYPDIVSMHVINLDRDKAKMERFLKHSSEQLPNHMHVIRWKAVYGKELEVKDMTKNGIGKTNYVVGKGNYQDQFKDLRNLGAIGCYLSHRSLIEYLTTIKAPVHAAHLILEDDVTISPDLFSGKTLWNDIRKTIPSDWDIVYIGMTLPIGKQVCPGILQLQTDYNGVGNWGTHAYLVRHGSLNKIIKWLHYMVDAIDNQYNLKFNEWNVYAIDPPLIGTDDSIESTIQTM
jgi:GR25 family glycosyltransferase involved in LPS biosynthesis